MNITQLNDRIAYAAPDNWPVAIAVALLTFVVLHGAQIILRRRLAKREAARLAAQTTLLATSPDAATAVPGSAGLTAELLGATLARTSKFAVLLISILAGLSLLELAPPWERRVDSLWFIVSRPASVASATTSRRRFIC